MLNNFSRGIILYKHPNTISELKGSYHISYRIIKCYGWSSGVLT